MRAASLLPLHEAPPLGEAGTAGPAPMPQAEPARAMASYLQQAAPNTSVEALSMLRRMFPDAPLADRVAAFAAAMRR